MSKIIPTDLVKGMSGKLCQHSDTSFAYNRSSGTVISRKLCNPYTGPATEAQMAQRVSFGKLTRITNEWLKANRPSEAAPHGTEAYQEAQRIKKALRLSNVRQVLHKYMDVDGGIKLPGMETAYKPSDVADGNNAGNGTGGSGVEEGV